MKKLFKKILIRIAYEIRPLVFLVWKEIINYKSKKLFEKTKYAKSKGDESLRLNGIIIEQRNDAYYENLRDKIDLEKLNIYKEEMLGQENEMAFTVDVLKDMNKNNKLKFIEDALSDENLSKIIPYLGFLPRLSSIYIMYNVPSKNQVGSKKWHRDTQVHRGVNVFTALSEIGEENGKYSAVPLSIIAREKEIKVVINKNKSDWDNSRVSDEEMENYATKSQIYELIGDTGITAIVESGEVYHKGGHCLSKDRLMLEISYQSDIYPGENILKRLEIDEADLPENIANDEIKLYMLKGYKNEDSKLNKIIRFIERRGRKKI